MSYTTTANGLKLRGDIKFFYSVPTEYAPAEVAFDSSTQDLVSDAGLETAILIMLFSDKRASADDVLPDSLSNDIVLYSSHAFILSSVLPFCKWLSIFCRVVCFDILHLTFRF